MKQWLFNVAVAADVFWNVVLRGYPDETISARAATAKRNGKAWGCVLCRVLDWFDPGHCDAAIVNDAARAETAETDLGDPT